MDFYFQHLRGKGVLGADLLSQVDMADANSTVSGRWGAFTGLFGLASTDLYLVCAGANPVSAQIEVRESAIWQPTARPTDAAPCQNQGLYVFRSFWISTDSVEQFVDLSAQAWLSFEGADDYQTRPMGLFRTPGDDLGEVKMMLVTWYDGFSSWQTSRAPAPAAKKNFQRRQALCSATHAVATRLVLD